MQFITLWLSDIVAVVGVYYIIAAANLNTIQIIQLLASILISLAVVNLLIPLYVALTTPATRVQLHTRIKGKPTPKNKSLEEIETFSWQEVYTLPSRIVIVEALSIILLVILPVILFMRWIGGVEINQAVHTAIGSLLFGSSIVILNTLLLERILVPVRQLLLPPAIKLNKPPFGSRLLTRLLGIIAFLLITTIIMLAGIGFQRSINASLPGADVPYEIAQFQKQALILGVMVLILGLTLGGMLTRSISWPVQEIIKTLERVRSGDLTNRAKIITSDETSHLTYQLNQLLDQLQISHINLERQVEERTSDLKQRTTQLQAATRISQDTSTARDLQTLLSRTVHLISDYYGFYHTGIYLTDTTGEYVVLHAASSEGGKKMISRGYKLEIGQRGVVAVAAYENRLHLIMDSSLEATYQENPDLPKTQSQIAIPLAPRGNVIGVLDIQSIDQHAFSSDDMELLRTLADQIALAILNVQLIEENRLALNQMETVLSENARRAWSEHGREQNRAYRYTPTGLTVVHSSEAEKVTSEYNTLQLAIPIALRGQAIGNIELLRKGENPWSEADRSLAAEVANQIGLALENSRLLHNAQQRALHEQSLSDLTARLGLSVDTDALLQTAVRELHQLPNVTEVSIFLTPPEEVKSGETS
jgi:GAF domain-containing protein